MCRKDWLNNDVVVFWYPSCDECCVMRAACQNRKHYVHELLPNHSFKCSLSPTPWCVGYERNDPSIRRMGAVEQSTGFIICWNCHISFSKRSLTLHYRWLFVFLPLLFLIWHLCFIRRALYFCLLVVDKSSSGKKYVEKGREMATITASQFFHLRRAP